MQVRLTKYQLQSIKECFRKYFTPNDELWVFGSRADLKKRGGDIDLYMETKLTDSDAHEAKNRFLSDLKAKIGDQKIDFVIGYPDFRLPIHDIAKQEGIKIIMNKNIEILQSEIKICETHALRIKQILTDIGYLFPITERKIEHLSNQEIYALDSLMGRFSKLQDHIGQKIFPAFLNLLMENIENKSFIDMLNLLEKKEIIPSVQFWDNMREIRNQITHEYPDKPDLMTKGLNNCALKSQELVEYWDQIKKRIQKSMST